MGSAILAFWLQVELCARRPMLLVQCHNLQHPTPNLYVGTHHHRADALHAAAQPWHTCLSPAPVMPGQTATMHCQLQQQTGSTN